MPGSAPSLCRIRGRDAFHITHYVGGKRHRISTHTADPVEADRILKEFIADLNAPAPPKPITVGEILDAYLADREATQIPGLERIRWSHKALARHLGQRQPETLQDATVRLYSGLRAQEAGGAQSKRPGVSTIWTELVALQAALRWAAKRKLIVEVPDIGTLPTRPPPRERWLTRDEAQRLIEACDALHLRVFVAIGLNTGARHRTILGLTWDRVDLERRLIDFREPDRVRTRKRQVPVPINDTLMAELVRASGLRVSVYVVEYGGRRVASVKHGFRRACERARLRGVTPHVLRHTVGTWLAQKGVSMWDIAGMLGDTLA